MNGAPAQCRLRSTSGWQLRPSRRLMNLKQACGRTCASVSVVKGVSTGDFEEALVALFGKDAGGLSASTVARLKDAWS